MTTQEIAERLVALCRKGEFAAAHKELFSADAVNIEPYSTPDFPSETRGLEAIHEKDRKFTALIEQVHALEISDPLVATDSFACTMRLDLTIKGHGRINLLELCTYDVAGGKIVCERFHERFPA
jgi:limonene-1,2-epoxide hydrolase